MKKFVALFLTLIIAIPLVSGFNVSAQEAKRIESEIFAVSRGGDTRIHPQNSLEAIEACLELDIDAISATARKTKDGKIVLFENESTLDVCIDKSGNRIDKKISETDYKTLSSYYLLSPGSKVLSKKTESRILLMTDAFKAIDGKMIMIIDCESAILDDIYNEIFLNGFVHDVIIRCRDMKPKDLYNWASQQTAVPEIMASYHGNVIFSAISTYNYAVENNFCSAEFTTKNQYGVVFSNFFTKRFGKDMKICASVYDPDLCGKRPDNVTGWEDLISRGCTIIETNKAAEFSSYIKLVEENLYSLNLLYTALSSKNYDTYSARSLRKFNKYMDEAKQILTSEKASSATQISECIENLNLAADEIELSDGSSDSLFVVTPMRIFWIVFALALFISSQVYLFRKTEKSRKSKKKSK